MPFGAHETMEVHEILNEKINAINHFSMYQQQCQHPELQQIIGRHLQSFIQSYDQLVAYTHDYSAAKQAPVTYSIPQTEPQQIAYGLRNPAPQSPQPSMMQMTDQQIVQSALLCHKNSAKNHTAAALECADPHVREMLLNGAINCVNQAYEIFLWMNQNGLYQVPTLQENTAKTFLHTYQPVQQQSYQM